MSMVLYRNLLLACLVIAVLHCALKLLTYFLFGFTFRYINPFKKSVYGLKFTQKKVDNLNISIEKIELQFSLFLTKQRYVHISVANVNINLKNFDPDNHTDNSTNTNNSEIDEKSLEKKYQELTEKYFDPNSPISLYSNNKRLRRLTKCLICYLPNCSFNIANTNVEINPNLSVFTQNISWKTNLHKSHAAFSYSKARDNQNFVSFSAIELQKMVVNNGDTDRILSKLFEQCGVSLKIEINLKTGNIIHFEPVFSINGIDVSIIEVLKIINFLNPNFQADDEDHVFKKDHKVRTIPKYQLYFLGCVYRLLKMAKFNIQFLKISEIPITSKKIIKDALIRGRAVSSDEMMFASVSIDSFSLNAAIIDSTQVGFSLKFVEDSFPLRWIIALRNLKLSLNYSKLSKYSGSLKQFDVLSVPNLLLTIESTMMVNLLRVIFNDFVEGNFLRRQTIMSIQLTVTNPTVDISTEQLAFLLRRVSELKTHNTSDDDGFSSKNYQQTVVIETKIGKYRASMMKMSPRIECNILVEKPLLLLKSENDIKNDQDVHLLVFQPSLIGFTCDFETFHEKVKAKLKANIPGCSLLYQRNNLISTSTPIAVLTDLTITMSMQLLKLDHFSLKMALSKLDIDLSKIMPLNGISIIINLLSLHMMKLKVTAEQYREPVKQKHEEAKAFFKDLPIWFTSFIIDINSLRLKIMSKSIFMKVEDLLDENDDEALFWDSKLLAPSLIIFKFKNLNFKILSKSHIIPTDEESTHASEKSKNQDDYYWNSKFTLSEAELGSYNFDLNLKPRLAKKIISIPIINATIYCSKRNIYEVFCDVSNVFFDYCITSHFTLFSSISLLKNVISYHQHKLFQNITSAAAQSRASGLQSKISKPSDRFKFVHLKWNVREVQLKMLMPGEFDFRLDLYDLKGICANNSIVLKKRLVRFAVKKDNNMKSYNRMVAIESLFMVVKLPTTANPITRINVKDKLIHISVPSNFIVHSLFEAIKLTVKLTKKFVTTMKIGLSTSKDKIKPSGILKLPRLKLKSNSLSLVFDDDPFEADLGMIYQLGFIEQKCRIEKQRQLDNILNIMKVELLAVITDNMLKTKVEYYLDNLNSFVSSDQIKLTDEKLCSCLKTCYMLLHKLRVNMAKSWVTTVDEFRRKRRNIVGQNMEFLSNKIVSMNLVSPNFNAEMISLNDLPPLMSLLFDDVDVKIAPADFEEDNGNVKAFLNRVGKGVPLSTEWDKIIPMKLFVQASEVRMHLKDFPLPVVYIPNASDKERYSNSFIMKSTIVVAEQLPQTDREYWYKYIPMISGIKSDYVDRYYSYNAPATVTSVKTYYEIDCDINTDNPTIVTWSVGYQPILRQLNICFDTFSKVTKDPSPKLGVWDKLRNIFHGYAKINWVNDNSEVMLNIPNSTDPYKILSGSSGFSLIFKNNVRWLINDPARELVRDYFIFKSNSMVFGVPDHLSQHFPCWCSKDLVFFPLQTKDKVLTSMFGYYLNTDAYCDYNYKVDNVNPTFNEKKFKTRNISLNGDLELKISMTFQRKLKDGTTTEEFKPHYENVLTCPEFVKEDDFDSYRGFRSDYIHMALNLNAKKSLNNFLRLSPKSVYQFVKWFGLFSGDLSLPIKNGSLWGKKATSVSLGSHLKTFKFKFNVAPLFIYHGYRVDLANPDSKTVIGLKARIGSFRCDLHERKENMIKHVKFLDKKRNIMKMVFYIGKVEILNFDLRVVGLKFNEARYHSRPTHEFEIFDNDTSWISLDDYEELDMKSIAACDIKGQIFPVLFAVQFTYWMNKQLSKNQFGNENSHDCMIDTKTIPKKQFNHIFDINKLKLKWFSSTRNLLFEYASELSFRSAYAFGTSYGARLNILKKILQSKPNIDITVDEKHHLKSTYDDDNLLSSYGFYINNVETFKEAMRNVQSKFATVVPVDDFLIRSNDVQVQFMLDPTADDLILFCTKYNEIEIVTLRDDGWYEQVKKLEHAQRVGTIFEDADLMAISKKEYACLNKKNKHYGSTESWPAFLDGNEPEKFITDRTIISDVLIYCIYERASNTFSGDKCRNKLYLNIPKFKTRIDSEAYLSFFNIVSKLIIYTSPQKKAFAEMVQAVAMATDEKDHELMFQKLGDIWGEKQLWDNLLEYLSPQRFISNDNLDIEDFIHVKQSEIFLNSVLLTRLINLNLNPENREDDDNCFMEWFITAEQINVELINNGLSFMILKIKQGSFLRLEMLDKSSLNRVLIGDIKLLNNDNNILFPETLRAFQNNDLKNKNNASNLLKCMWEVGERQKGVANIRNVDIFCSPVKICMEDKTGLKLMKFFFPDELKHKTNELPFPESDFYESYHVSNMEVNNSQMSEYIQGDETKSRPSLDKILLQLPESPGKIAQNSIPNGDVKILSSESDDSNSLLTQDSLLKSRSSTSGIKSAFKNVESTHSSKLNREIIQSKILDTNVAIEKLIKLGISTNKIDSEVNAEGLKKMSEKAKKYFIIRKMFMQDVILNITFSGKGKFRLINVNNLTLKVPRYIVKEKLWTSIDIVNSIKKHIIKSLLKHTGKLLKNKMFVYKRHKRLNILKRKSKK